MANVFSNPTIFAKEALRQLKNNCVAAKNVFRGYESEWKTNVNGYKKGATVNVTAPAYFRVKDGATVDVVDLKERYTTFVIAYRKHVAWEVTAQEMTLNIDQYSERFLKPAMQALANYIDATLLGLYKYIPNQLGTPGTTPSNFLTFALAGARLSDFAVPQDNRVCIVNPITQAYVADHLKNLFHEGMVDDAVKKGFFGKLAGFDFFVDQNVATHTVGTWGGSTAVLVDDTVAEGDADMKLDQNGSGSAFTLKQGDIFTVGSVNAVNPISGASLGYARQFVIDADTLFVDIGAGDMEVTPTMTPGTSPYQMYDASANEEWLPYQNMTALPLNNAAVTPVGSSGQQYPVNLAMHKDCLGLAMVPLAMPASAHWKAQESYDGFNIRCIRYYTGDSDKEMIRFDVLFGVKCLNPFMGCRIAG